MSCTTCVWFAALRTNDVWKCRLAFCTVILYLSRCAHCPLPNSQIFRRALRPAITIRGMLPKMQERWSISQLWTLSQRGAASRCTSAFYCTVAERTRFINRCRCAYTSLIAIGLGTFTALIVHDKGCALVMTCAVSTAKLKKPQCGKIVLVIDAVIARDMLILVKYLKFFVNRVNAQHET